MSTTELICLRCRTPLDPAAESCPQCAEKVTQFQRTYSTKLIDGKYQILDRLGVGGMGEIFKVRHIHLNEQRVIKIMRANIAADDQALQRFLHEAKLSTTVKHRNLAMLYDFATLEDGSYYMVWEFIDGVNIQKWISKNGPVPARLAVEIAAQHEHGAPLAPLARSQRSICRKQAPGLGKHQRESEVGRRIGEYARGVAHQHTALGAEPPQLAQPFRIG